MNKKTLYRLSLPIYLLLSLFSQNIAAAGRGHMSDKPNIIYILADDLGYGDLSCFNTQGKIKTPHIDQLAADGMMFQEAHTSSSVCTPTRYGILTGRYNWRSPLKRGVLNGMSKALIPKERSTVASMLKQNGYQTAFLGKWHLGWNWTMKSGKPGQIDYTQAITHSPNDLGFDYAYGFSGSLDMPPYVYVENGKATSTKMSTCVDTGKYSWWRKGDCADNFVHEQVTPHLFEKAEQYVLSKANDTAPFFLYLPLPSPHTPILPTKEWQGKSGLLPFADFVMQIDAHIGHLMQVIKEAGIEENTIVIFTSDNGCSKAAGIEEMISMGHFPSGPFRGSKSDIFEGGHHVPFIVKWPRVIAKKSISKQLVSTVDLYATLADLLQHPVKDNEAEDSFSMLPAFRGEKKEGQRTSIITSSIEGKFAIQKGEWKLIFTEGSGGWSAPKTTDAKKAGLPELQLYNLARDTGEKNNLVNQYPEKAKELKELITKEIFDGRSTLGDPQQNDPPFGNRKWEQIGQFQKN